MPFRCENDESTGKATVFITGDLTLQVVGDLRTELLSVMSSAKSLEIDLGDVTSVDTAGIQLVCAAHRLAAKRGIDFKSLAHAQRPEVIDAMKNIGYDRINCPYQKNSGCLWEGVFKS